MTRTIHVVYRVALAIALVYPGCNATKVVANTPVEAKEFGELPFIKDGEFRLGEYGRMFLIENQWEWDRCKRVVPELPKIDLEQQSLLAIVAGAKQKRTFESANADNEQLVVAVQQPPRPRFETLDYHPPKLIVVGIPAWRGPVRFDLNGHPQFTILRGQALEQKVDEIWEEILRLHSGGHVSDENYIRYFQQRRPEPLTEDEIRRVKTQYWQKMKSRSAPEASMMYSILFRDLAQLQAKPVTPRIWKLIDSMGQFDKAFDPAWKTLVAIGGSEVEVGCRTALKSENPRSRSAAALVLRDLAAPDTRIDAHHMLATGDGQLVRLGGELLRRIGFAQHDVLPMLTAIERIENETIKNDRAYSTISHFSIEDIDSMIFALGSLGQTAEKALPTLERIAEGKGYPAFARTPGLARDAIEKIRPSTSSPDANEG
jgi:hypothetical protein